MAKKSRLIDQLSNERSLQWAVIGGGMLGLSAAHELAKRGQKVVVFEAAETLGGLASAWNIGNVVWDKFYHVTLLSDTALRSLLSELQLDREIEWVQTRTGFFAGGKLYSLSTSLDFLKFPVLNFYQKLRLGGTIFLASKIRDWKRLEGLTVEQWLRRWSGNSTFEKIWLPLLKCKLGEAYRRTSAGFIWAYIDRMYKARRTGMKREMFGYVPGGYGRILESYLLHLQKLGVSVRTNAPVESITWIESAKKFEIRSDGAGNELQQFDRVIVTSPTKVAAKICKGIGAEERKALDAVEYLGVACTSLLLDRPLGGYYVTNILDEGIPLTGVIEMGSILPPEKLDGGYLVYLPQYMMCNDERFDESDEVVHERCVSTLEKMYPTFDRSQVRAIKTARARNVMALPTLNYSEKLPPVKTNISGLYLLSSARIVKGTLNVNETLELMQEELNHVVWPDHLQLEN